MHQKAPNIDHDASIMFQKGLSPPMLSMTTITIETDVFLVNIEDDFRTTITHQQVVCEFTSAKGKLGKSEN